MQKLTVFIILLLSFTLQPSYADNQQTGSPAPATPDIPGQQANTVQKITILEWQYRGKIDYEQEIPGYGVGYQFISQPGQAFIDVYRYDMGKKNWLEGIDDPDLINILDIAKNEINSQLKKGAYLQADFTELTQTTIAGQDFYVQPVYLETPQHQMTSFIYLSVLNHRLLKFRISYLSPPSSYDIEQINRQFIEESINSLKQFE
jgi:hypothetical protein